MIRRASDTSLFSESEFDKLKKIINKNENRKLYKVCSNQKDANLAISELKLKGYKYDVVLSDSECKVYSVFPESINKEEAEKSGNFKKIAFGRYCFQRPSINDGKYDFDDGSIWKVITAEDGKQYLAKEVDDKDEDEVIRTKLASLKKQAANDLVVTDNNINNLINILFSNLDTFYNQILQSDKKQMVFEFVKNYYDDFINSYIMQYNIQDQTLINSIKDEVNNQIANNQLLNLDSVKVLIDEMINDADK